MGKHGRRTATPMGLLTTMGLLATMAILTTTTNTTPYTTRFARRPFARRPFDPDSKLFKLISRYAGEPEAIDWLTSSFPTLEDCLLEILRIIRSYPKLTNEAYAQVFKQLRNPHFCAGDKPNAIIDKKIIRPKSIGNTDADSTGEGDPR